MRFVIFVLASYFLAACSAVPVKYSEGFSEEKSSAGVYTVKFTGNGFSDPSDIEKGLNRRCAELTLREGYDWFTFYTKSRNDEMKSYSKSMPSYYGVIHMHKGVVGEDGFDAKKIVVEPLPKSISN